MGSYDNTVRPYSYPHRLEIVEGKMKTELIRPYAQKAYEYRVANNIAGHMDNDWELGSEYILGKWHHFLPFEIYIKAAFDNKLTSKKLGQMPRGKLNNY